MSARLPGFVRYRVSGMAYPGIRPKSDAVAEGALLAPMGPGALRRLDAFEGKLYRRERHDVVLGTGEVRQAFVYVVQRSRRHRLSRREWVVRARR